DGDYLAIGGFGCDRIPTAVVHEILRQGIQDLSFAGHTATHDFQLLCAGNLTGRGRTLAKVDVAYVVGLEARGLSPHARRVLESGEVVCTEWSNYTLAVRFKAAAMGLPFLPARSLLGTDTFARSAACVITCPFTGERLAATPAPCLTSISPTRPTSPAGWRSNRTRRRTGRFSTNTSTACPTSTATSKSAEASRACKSCAGRSSFWIVDNDDPLQRDGADDLL